MPLNRRTRIGAIGLASLLAAALSVGVAATAAAAPFDAAIEGRAVAPGLEMDRFSDLDEARRAEILALFAADHDDETLRREIGVLLDRGDDADTTG